jgi:hypothetical protein
MKSIATEDGVSLSVVRDSIKDVAMFNSMFNEKFLQAGEIQMLEELRGLKRLAIEGALKAETVYRDPETNKEIAREPNTEAQLRAVEILNEELATIVGSHKGPGIAVNVNQQQNNNNVSASDAGMSFENVLRKVQAKRSKNLELPAAAPEQLPPPSRNALEDLDIEIEPEGVEVESRPERSVSQ